MTTKYVIKKFKISNFSLRKLKIRLILGKDNFANTIEGKVKKSRWKEINDSVIVNL